VYLPAFAAISMLASLVIHFTVEKPFLILKDGYRASRRDPIAVADAPRLAT
jgi:hypothetical protein